MKLRIEAGGRGLLHVGQARVALATWLLARRHGAAVTLRLEEAEGPAADAARQDLRWLGLDWDDETARAGNAARYEAAAERLRRAGRLYPCFESEEELRAKQDRRQRRGESAVYDRAMLKLTPEQRAKAEAGGKRPYWRFRLADEAVRWDDLVAGRQEVKLTAHSDPVAMRADGTALPLFAAAVDDLAEGITHVVREADLTGMSGLQLDVAAAMGAGRRGLRLGHLPPLAEGRGARLPSLRSLRTDGIEPTALVGYLAGAAAEPPALLAARFELARMGEGRHFAPEALLSLNREAIAGLPFEAVREHLPHAATPAFWLAVRGSLDLLREARGWWEVVGGTIVPPPMEAEHAVLTAALAALPPEPWDGATWPRWLSGLPDGAEPALRLALTGEEHGPALDGLLPLIGRARVEERLRLAAA